MFTGIVEAVGTVAAVEPGADLTRLVVDAAAIAEEAQYSFSGVYLPCANAAVCQGLLRGYVPSAGVVLSIEATGSAFIGTATHPSGTRLWKFESDVGRFVFQTSGP